MDRYDCFWPYGNNCVAIAVAMGQQVIRLIATPTTTSYLSHQSAPYPSYPKKVINQWVGFVCTTAG
jgi:hypothetical protein